MTSNEGRPTTSPSSVSLSSLCILSDTHITHISLHLITHKINVKDIVSAHAESYQCRKSNTVYIYIIFTYLNINQREDEYVGKRVMAMDVPGKRRRGRPKRRWLDSIRNDLSERELSSRVPVSVRHVAIGESNQELAKRNLYIFASLAKSNK